MHPLFHWRGGASAHHAIMMMQPLKQPGFSITGASIFTRSCQLVRPWRFAAASPEGSPGCSSVCLERRSSALQAYSCPHGSARPIDVLECGKTRAQSSRVSFGCPRTQHAPVQWAAWPRHGASLRMHQGMLPFCLKAAQMMYRKLLAQSVSHRLSCRSARFGPIFWLILCRAR